MRAHQQVSAFLAAAITLAMASSAFAADDGAWTVSKSSGEVWLANSGAQPASLTPRNADVFHALANGEKNYVARAKLRLALIGHGQL